MAEELHRRLYFPTTRAFASEEAGVLLKVSRAQAKFSNYDNYEQCVLARQCWEILGAGRRRFRLFTNVDIRAAAVALAKDGAIHGMPADLPADDLAAESK